MKKKKFVKNSFEKSLKMIFFNSYTLYLKVEVFRRVELLYQSEVRVVLGAISARLIDFVDRVFR